MTRNVLIALFGASAIALTSVAATPVTKPPGRGGDTSSERSRAKEGPVKVGDQAPDFTLTDINGKSFNLAETTKQGKIVVLEWFNPDCPAVVLHHQKNPTFKNLVKDFGDKDVVFVAINSAAPGKQGYGQERNLKAAKDFEITYPILQDEEGTVGKAYGAKVTPHMYIINKDGALAYAGAIDNGNPGRAGDKNHVSAALNEIIAGQTVTTAETKAYGCAVKYKNN